MSTFITAHNADGKAIFSNEVPLEQHQIKIPNSPPSDTSGINIIYTTHTLPPNLSTPTDKTQYAHDRTHGLAPGTISPPSGFAASIVTLGPGKSPNHRTMTLDVLYILEGVVELVLDSGEKRICQARDCVVQRGTMHQWENVTPGGEVVRMFAVAVGIGGEKFEVGGRDLGTEWHFEGMA